MSHPLVPAIREGLAEAADATRAPDMQRYMKSAMPYRGVLTPAADRVFRAAWAAHPVTAHDEWQSVVHVLYDEAEFREERYGALFVVGRGTTTGWLDASALPLLRHLVVAGAWWDLVDATAAHVDHVLRTDRAETTPVLRTWAVADGAEHGADEMWVRRVAIISQLRAKSETDRALLRWTLEQNLPGSRFGDEFFIRKAIGWALRQYSKTDEAWVRGFVREHPGMSPLSRREALKWVDRAGRRP